MSGATTYPDVSHMTETVAGRHAAANSLQTSSHGCRLRSHYVDRDCDHDRDHDKVPRTRKSFYELLRTDHNTQRLSIFAVVFAIITGSVSLLSDAFHMLTDLSATCLAIYAIAISSRPNNNHFSYGFSRAPVLGGLANGIFLLSVSFMLSVEVCMKLVHSDELEEIDGHGLEITYVGAAGLAVNIVGMFLLGGHGHSHAGDDHHDQKREKSHGDLNMKAAWLHALGDTLGSVVVVVVGLVVHFGEGDWKYYMDPLLTAVLLAIITYSAVPLVRNCCQILAQGTPPNVSVEGIKDDLLEVDDGIFDIHDLHIWQLEPGNCCGSVHVIFSKEFNHEQYPQTADKLKSVFHKHDVHSVAIQPEFSDHICHDRTDCDHGSDICCTKISCLMACGPGCDNVSFCCADREGARAHKRICKAPPIGSPIARLSLI